MVVSSQRIYLAPWCSVVGEEKRKEKKRKDIDETATEVMVGGKVGVGRLVVARSGRLVVWWGVVCR